MDYNKIYNKDYFSGKNSFFYKMGYSNIFNRVHINTIFKQIKKYINKKEGKILDIGCAYGFMLENFSDKWQKFGIDVSEHAISQAKKRLPDADFKTDDVENKLPFEEDFFDVILLNDVLEHLENPKKALENIFVVLKKGGLLYITTPNLNFVRKIIFKKADKLEHHISLMAHTDLKRLLEDIGFKIEKRWTFANLPFYLKFKSNIGIESAFVCKK